LKIEEYRGKIWPIVFNYLSMRINRGTGCKGNLEMGAEGVRVVSKNTLQACRRPRYRESK
jgi:hypothetical protein